MKSVRLDKTPAAVVIAALVAFFLIPALPAAAQQDTGKEATEKPGIERSRARTVIKQTAFFDV
ncbi:MAG: hypothetical protein GY856_51945, partial [bacterium]|nr:hypothetical protein [bacterium]